MPDDTPFGPERDLSGFGDMIKKMARQQGLNLMAQELIGSFREMMVAEHVNLASAIEISRLIVDREAQIARAEDPSPETEQNIADLREAYALAVTKVQAVAEAARDLIRLDAEGSHEIKLSVVDKFVEERQKLAEHIRTAHPPNPPADLDDELSKLLGKLDGPTEG